MNTKILKKILLVSIFLGVVFVSVTPVTTTALTDYKVLVQLPGIGDNSAGTTNFQDWLPKAFNLAVGVAAGLAFVMITIGGIMYATTDAINNKEEGRKYITNAIYGLLLVIGAYVILYAINPQILNFNLILDTPTAPPTTPINTGTPIIISGVSATDTQARQLLAGTRIQAKNPCPAGVSSNCVSFDGVKLSSITAIKGLQATCNCDIFITGGTEGGHSVNSDHYKGLAFDFRASDSLKAAIVGPNAPKTLPACYIPVNNGPVVGKYLWEPKGSKCGGTVASTEDHWHVSY